jgi:hypothetical protein
MKESTVALTSQSMISLPNLISNFSQIINKKSN